MKDETKFLSLFIEYIEPKNIDKFFINNITKKKIKKDIDGKTLLMDACKCKFFKSINLLIFVLLYHQ
jgi:hypothetical protein